MLGCQSAPYAGPEQDQDPVWAYEQAMARMDELQRQIEGGNIFEGNLQARTFSIGIIRPSNPPAGRLSRDEMWYLDMIRSAMSGNFTRFASGRIQVVNLSEEVASARNEEIIRSLSGPADELSLVARTAARSIMTGEIIKQGANRFILSFTVTDTETGQQLAAYNRTHSDIELIEGIAVNRATEDLLRQLNVVLNDAGRHALFGASNAADIALARGLEAASEGQGLRAMNYLFNAASFDNTATQANASLAAVQTRNQAELEGAGARVMDFFRRHELWQSRLDEFNDFYLSHAPFELFYTPPTPGNMRVSGQERSYDLHFYIGLRWNQNQISVIERVLQEYILDGLYSNPPGDIQAWDLRGYPDNSQLFRGPDNFVFNLLVNVENEHGYVISSGNIRLYGSLFHHDGRIYASCTQEVTMSFPGIVYIEDQITPHLYIRIVSINGVDIQTVGETGFMRVVQTQDNRLPPAQPENLPRELTSRLQRDIAADNRERRRQVKQRELENHDLRNSRISVGAYAGPAFGINTGTYNIEVGLGLRSFEFDFTFFGYFGTEKNITHSALASNPYIFGLRFGLGYVYVGRTWLFRAIPGFTLLLAERKEKKVRSDGSDDYTKSYFGGNLQTIVDWNPFRPGRGTLFLRMGYRLDIYPGGVAPVFGKSNSAFVSNTVFAGMAYYWGRITNFMQ